MLNEVADECVFGLGVLWGDILSSWWWCYDNVIYKVAEGVMNIFCSVTVIGGFQIEPDSDSAVIVDYFTEESS